MLKKRIVILLTLYDGVLFRTKKFVPDYRYTLNFVDLDFVDEVVILDVTPDGDRENFYRTIRDFTDVCSVPLAVGGDIRDIEEVNRLFGELPVEKVVIERGLENPYFALAVAGKWGRQSLCQGITLKPGGQTLINDVCCGEILVQSVDRDGSLLGYDLEFIKETAKRTSVPVIAGSGCGTWAHMREAFDAGADACATSCIHHFTPNAIRAAKQYLGEHGVPVRPI